tara:strand:- start:53 stop:643 length:591 start_codon:yes stop_codon:yes gene_type:complete
MILHRYFPTIIGVDMNPDHSIIESNAVDRCYELKEKISTGGQNWISKSTYNTLSKYNIFSDSVFEPINNFVIQSVKNYFNQLNVDLDCLVEEPTDAWFNIYQKGDYQEYHCHGGSIVSVVYFLKVDEDSAKIYFKQPYTDMLEPKYKNFTQDTFQTIFYTPQPGMILTFRSFLEHCVEKHDNDSERITLSYNFRRK